LPFRDIADGHEIRPPEGCKGGGADGDVRMFVSGQ
jgi:hypothetical protein